jgi:hypothetical protein
MFNFFEQPWTLLGAAVLVLFGVLTYRSVVPEKRRWWQLLVPVLIAAAAFGIDALVTTDKEKITAVLDKGIQAVEDENFSAIESYLSDDYRDSFHASKQQLIDHAQRELNMNMVEKSKRTNTLVKIDGNRANVTLFMQAVLSKNSSVSQIYNVPFVQLKVDVNFVKQNNNWLVSNIELRSVNQQPVKWSDIQ